MTSVLTREIAAAVGSWRHEGCVSASGKAVGGRRRPPFSSVHLKSEVRCREPELGWASIEEKHVVHAAVAAPVLVVVELKVVPRAGSAEDAETLAGKLVSTGATSKSRYQPATTAR
jgi:hypothetical protein